MVENVIWPAYLDAARTRSEGRRVAEDLAVEEPSVDEIAKAVQQIGYDATIERDKAYSREPWLIAAASSSVALTTQRTISYRPSRLRRRDA